MKSLRASGLVVVVMMLLSGCRDQIAADEPVLKISVSSSGEVTMNGEHTPVTQVLAAIGNRANTPGVIWYFADETMVQPNPVAATITDALIDAHLRVVYSADPRFADLKE